MVPQIGQAFGQRAEQRMGQTQIQSLDLLAMSAAELRERINEELKVNPALECADRVHTLSEAKIENSIPPAALYSAAAGVPQQYHPENRASAAASDAFQSFLENIPEPYHKGLRAHLLEQLRLQNLDPLTAAFAGRIIGNLNDDGFHEVPVSELFASDLNPATATKDSALARRTIRKALSAVRRLDPIGCATKDFKQSLLIQAKILFHTKRTREPLYAHTIDILEHHFAYLTRARPYSLARAMNDDSTVSYKLSQEEAEHILMLIASLKPFPGQSVPADTAPAHYIIPTAFIEQTDKEFTIRMNDMEIPLLSISPQLQAVGRRTKDTETQQYIKDHIQRARVFIGSLNQRERTITDVLRKIVLAQEAFFVTGDKRMLVPLTQQQIADALNVHESTISRTVAGKYLQCKWGVFEMRFFFTNSVSLQKQGASVVEKPGTKEGVKDCIKEILDANRDAAARLSDQKIAAMLQEKYGIAVARRTVTKYRKELDIGSSYIR